MSSRDGKLVTEDVSRLLSRLSPTRSHESSWLKSLLCKFGMHHWYQTEFGSVPPEKITFCLWCTKAKFRGATFEE